MRAENPVLRSIPDAVFVENLLAKFRGADETKLMNFGGIGLPELAVIVLLGILIFGAKRIPEIARSLGAAKGEFKRGLKDSEGDRRTDSSDPTHKP